MKPIWEPSPQEIANSSMMQFAKLASAESHRDLTRWRALYEWSIEETGQFWQLCSEFVQIRWFKKPKKSYVPPAAGKMCGAQWFPDGTLNFCQNMLPPPDNRAVILNVTEDGNTQVITGLQLHNEVAKLASFLKKHGIKNGDVVCGVVCNSYQTIAAMLATTALGAVWSSCSPDFGVAAVADRLEQIKPKAGFFSLGYTYNQRAVDCTQTIAELLRRLPALKVAISIDHSKERNDQKVLPLVSYEGIIGSPASNRSAPPEKISFVETPFNQPVYILFSSGTTGAPKCIVHGAGATLLQHRKEQILHTNLTPSDRLFYYTTCGWMMWNWMVSGLGCGASIVCYEGSPRFSKELGLWHVVDELDVSIFGTSPKFIAMGINEGWKPNRLPLKQLRSILATGSPVLPEHFTWTIANVKKVQIASISGGTDIVSCFMLGNPLLPVYAGEIQSAGLGMAIKAYDQEGKAVVGQRGELVCTKPFVAMPLYFLNDTNGTCYQQSYFAHYSDREVWRHGDFISINEHGGIVVFGRSDATLNPGGVRIGTAELYRCVEKIPGVLDSLAISYEFNPGDPSILLFVKLKDGEKWDKGMETHIKNLVRQGLSPRHVPHRIFAVADIPYTRNGKKVEISVKQVMNGESVPNLTAIANPSCLDEFVAIANLLKGERGVDGKG